MRKTRAQAIGIGVALVGWATLGLAGAARAQGALAVVGPRPLGAEERADRPLLPKGPRPTSVAIDGAAGFTTFLGGGAAVGPAWNVRVTANFSPEWAIEANYVGSANERFGGGGTLVLTEIDAGVRYNLLDADEAPLQPFVSAGVGYAGFAGPGGDMGAMVLPVGVGVERLITPSIRAGARVSYRPVFFEDLSTDEERARGLAAAPGGDTFAIMGHVGGAF